MDKKNKKILLITISIIWIIIEILIEGSIIDKVMNTGFEPFENITFILAIILLVIGISIENPKSIKNKKIPIYKFLKIIGYSPFIGILLFGIFSMFTGFTFAFDTSYGISALIGTIFFSSIIIWPLYILGITLIIVSNKKIKQLTNENKQNNKEK